MPVIQQELISMDPEVMGGVVMFAGTRVPIDTVLASLDAGVELGRLVASWPFLTEKHVDAARAYLEAHPSKAAPQNLGEVRTGWRLVGSTVVRRGKPK